MTAPLIVILGPTASGKSALALDLAQRFNGEIITADSRTIYRGMDIGTAKPTPAEQRLVPHHLLDIRNPDEPFSVAEFQALACRAIDKVVARGKMPFLVGGSGLYIDAVIYNFSFRRPANPVERQQLQELSVVELQALLAEKGIDVPHNQYNARHLVRAFETAGEVPQKTALRPNTLVIGLDIEKEILEEKLKARVDSMVEHGFVAEVKRVSQAYGWETPALLAPGYKAFRLYLAGQLSLDQAKQQFVQNDRQYAKRQKTWFRRNTDIQWISNPADAVAIVTTFLNK